MKKIVSLLLVVMLVLSMVSCASNSGRRTQLTLDNYEQYLKINIDGDAYTIFCGTEPVTSNYDFNDVKMTVRVQGEYPIYYRRLVGYSALGVPHYDSTQLHSTQSYDHTFELRLNIGGTVINTEDCYDNLVYPSDEIITTYGATSYGGSFDYEVVSISGTVERTN